MKSLTAFSERVASKLDRQIRSKWKDFENCSIELGNLLTEYRDKGYWKKHHSTFRDYCESIGISKTHVYRLLQCSGMVEALPDNLKEKIIQQAQARVLIDVPEKDRPEVIQRAEKNGDLTPKNLTLARQQLEQSHHTESVPKGDKRVSVKPEPKTLKKVYYDEIGIPLPDDAIPYWERRQEVQDVLTQISKLKSIVVTGREAQDHQWLKVSNSIADTFDSLRSLISEAKPYAVCTTCQGVPSMSETGCNFCRSTGLISKWQWDTQSRKEIKDMMLMRAADLKKERENVH